MGLAQLTEIRLDLHAMFKFAIKSEFDDFDRSNPFQELEFITQPKRNLITIESQHFAPILRAADLLSRDNYVTEGGLVVPWIVTMFATSLLAGLRRGEARALMWDRIDWDNGAIRIDRAMRRGSKDINERTGAYEGEVLRMAVGLPKGDKIREVPLSDQLRAILEPLYEARDKDVQGRPFVFPNEFGGMREDTRVHNAFKNLCKWMHELVKDVPMNAKPDRELPRSRWSRFNAVAAEMLESPEFRLPDIFDRLDYRDSRNSFSSYLNELGIPQATHQQIMGHGAHDVTGTFYTRITSRAFQDARERMSLGWQFYKDDRLK